MLRHTERRKIVRWMVDYKQISQRKACSWVGLSRDSMAEPEASKEKDKELENRIQLLAQENQQWGALRIYKKLREEGLLINHKRVTRLYKALGLGSRRKTKKNPLDTKE